MNIKGSLLQLINLHINVTFTNHDTKSYTQHNLFKLVKKGMAGLERWFSG